MKKSFLIPLFFLSNAFCISPVLTPDSVMAGGGVNVARTKFSVTISSNSAPTLSTFSAKCYSADTLAFSSPKHQCSGMNRDTAMKLSDSISGVAIKPSPGNNVRVVIPYGVVIGNSIAIGNQNFGRLQPIGTSACAPSFQPAFASFAGQFSYDFSKKTNLPWVNQGIGGNTTKDLRARWYRDAWGDSVTVGDGCPDTTLKQWAHQKPAVIYLHIGVNDFNFSRRAAQSITNDTTKKNLRFFAKSALDSGVTLIMANIGADSNLVHMPDFLQDSAQAIDKWIKDSLLVQYPSIHLVNYLNWSTGGYDSIRNTGNLVASTAINSDNLHPTRNGNTNYADYWERSVRAMNIPIYLQSLQINQKSIGLGGFRQAVGFSFNGNHYSIPRGWDFATIKVGNLSNTDSALKAITIDSTAIVFDTTASPQYTGFASVAGILSTTPDSTVIKALNSAIASVTASSPLSSSGGNTPNISIPHTSGSGDTVPLTHSPVFNTGVTTDSAIVFNYMRLPGLSASQAIFTDANKKTISKNASGSGNVPLVSGATVTGWTLNGTSTMQTITGTSFTNSGILFSSGNPGLWLQTTSDGSDSRALWTCGGGDNNPGRGACVVVNGNEASEGGSVFYQLGGSGTGVPHFRVYNSSGSGIGMFNIWNDGNVAQYGNDSASGNFYAGGIIIDTTASVTVTLSGCTSGGTGTAVLTRSGRAINIDIPDLSCTSNSTTAVITGIPASFWPNRDTKINLISTTNTGITTVGGFGTFASADGSITLSSNTISLITGASTFSAVFGNGTTKGVSFGAAAAVR